MMETYTISGTQGFWGIQLDSHDDEQFLSLGEGSYERKIKLFRKNSPTIEGIASGGDQSISMVFPLSVAGETLLAKPNKPDERHARLVKISTRSWNGLHGFPDFETGKGSERRENSWRFVTPENGSEVSWRIIATSRPPRDLTAIGIEEALIIMIPGDAVQVTDENGRKAEFRYVSPEAGIERIMLR